MNTAQLNNQTHLVGYKHPQPQSPGSDILEADSESTPLPLNTPSPNHIKENNTDDTTRPGEPSYDKSQNMKIAPLLPINPIDNSQKDTPLLRSDSGIDTNGADVGMEKEEALDNSSEDLVLKEIYDDEEENKHKYQEVVMFHEEPKVPPIISNNGHYMIMCNEEKRGITLVKLSRAQDNKGSLRQRHSSSSSHSEDISCLGIFHDDCTFISGSLDKSVIIWDFDESEIINADSITFDSPVINLATHPTQKIFAVCVKGSIVHMRHLANKNADEVRIALQDSHLTCLALSQDQLIYGTDMGKAYVWNYDNPHDPVFMCNGHLHPVKHLCQSSGYLATQAKDDEFVCIWSLQTGKLKRRISTTLKNYKALAFCGLQSIVVMGSSEHELFVYSTVNRQQITREELAGGNVISLRIKGDNIVALFTTGKYRSFDLDTWTSVSMATSSTSPGTLNDSELSIPRNSPSAGERNKAGTPSNGSLACTIL